MSKTDSLLQEVGSVSIATPPCFLTWMLCRRGNTGCISFSSQVADVQGDMYHLKQSLFSELRVSSTCIL